MATTIERLESALAPALNSLGAELLDVELRANTLQVVIDRPEGLDLEILEAAARRVSSLLDEREDLAPEGRYQLEVTSPGLERRLRRPEHFARVRGSRIAVRTQPGTPGDRRFEGELAAVDEQGISLRRDDATELSVLSFADIERAHTVFDWKADLAARKHRRTDDTPQAAAHERGQAS